MLENIVVGILAAAALAVVSFMFYRTVTGKGAGRCGCSCSFDPTCSRKDAPPAEDENATQDE